MKTNSLLVALVVGLLSLARAGELQWVTANGSQYVMTGYTAQKGDAYDYWLDAELEVNNGWGGVNGIMQFKAAADYGVDTDRHMYHLSLDAATGVTTIYVDGVNKKTVSNPGYSGEIGVLKMGGYNGTLQRGKVYSFQLYKNGSLVLDLVPWKFSDEDVRFRDKKTGTAYGTGLFGAGDPATTGSEFIVQRPPTQYYHGAALTPQLTVTDLESGEELTEGEDFKVESWTDNDKVGLAGATVVGLGEYEGCTKQVNFDIVWDIAVAELGAQALPASGRCEPEVVATEISSSRQLVRGEDYTLSYLGNQTLGSAKIVVTGLRGLAGCVITNGFLIAFTNPYPDGFALLASLKSDGHQLVDTGYLPAVGDGLDVDLTTPPSLAEGAVIFGAEWVSYGQTFGVFKYMNTWNYCFWGAMGGAAGLMNVVARGNLSMRFMRSSTGAIRLDYPGNDKPDCQSQTEVNTTSNVFLFGTSDGEHNSACTIRHFMAMTNGVARCSLLPAVRLKDCALGFYDFVTGRFCENVGTAPFLLQENPSDDLTIDEIPPQHLLRRGTRPSATVRDKIRGRTLVPGVDYDQGYRDNCAMGTGLTYIFGKGDYAGIIMSKTFAIIDPPGLILFLR